MAAVDPQPDPRPEPVPDAVVVDERDDRTILVIQGDLDAVSAPAVRVALLEAIARGPQALDVDLAAVGFLDSAGVSALVVAHNRAAEAEIALRLVSVPRASLRILEITRLTDVFTIVD